MQKMLVACRQCGKAFDDLTEAHGHPGTCGSDQGFDVVEEDEAFQRCESYNTKRQGVCGRPLDEYGECDRASEHGSSHPGK